MRRLTIHAAVLLTAIVGGTALGQVLTLPPDGDNQKASVSQWIGPVEVTISYHSPDVTGPNGEDRRGKIWGQLVPWGMVDLGWGSCGSNCPWRAGANENTVFAVSHDVLVEGKPLAAGRYGLHMIPGQNEWTIIFSRNTDAWGSFFYDPTQDVLRVMVRPRKHPYTHWLNYGFVDRQPDKAVAAMQWEELEVPWTIAVPDVDEIYVSRLRDELTGELGFSYLNWVAAARFCVQKKVNLEEGLRWAENAVGFPWVGQEDFTTLQILARLQAANGLTTEADATLSKAINHPTASVMQVHTAARGLIEEGRKDKALEIFTINHDRHPDDLTTVFGLVRGLSAVGRYDEALSWAEKALQRAEGQSSKDLASEMIAKLRKGQDVN